ncbi:MAG TPA: nuclear transport factor 2 family protein [Thermoanaerobaculia bacterium]|nr:nuclear transport factor 2 family protein [Thermoanaerobaculia bacterium]
MKLLKACAALLPALTWLACQAGQVQPIVIDLSAPTATPGVAATPTPPPPPPPPSPTPVPRIAESAPMQPPPVPPPDKRAPAEGSPEAIAQSRIDAYNRRDVDSLVSLYASDVKVYEPPDRVRDSGAEQVRQSYVRRFASPDRTTLEAADRMIQGNFVVERLTESGGRDGSESSIVISEVHRGKIVRVWILR